jgi:hypothetical protein
MKIILDVVLEENTDKQDFLDSFDSETEVILLNIFENIPSVIAVKVEESFLEEFKKDPRVIASNERLEVFPTNLPPVESMTKNIISLGNPSSLSNGSDYAPLQFYLATDQIKSNLKIGRANSIYDDANSISNATYSSRWTGKNVDIVSLEVGPVSGSLVGVHDTHPDFDDLDNPGTSRIIPMDWTGLESSDNIQVSSNSCLSSHGMGVVSAAAGTISGFAKKSSIRLAYLNSSGEESIPGSTTDGPIEIINSIISWHNSKPINPETGTKNPTILIGEYQYLRDRLYPVRMDDVQSITTPDGTVNRPGVSWGTDFTPFTSRNIIPFQVNLPSIGYEWCIVLPSPSESLSLKTAISTAWDVGITVINAAGNNAGVYVKNAEQTSYYITLSSATLYFIDRDPGASGISSITNSTSGFTGNLNVFKSYGPHGNEKGIDVGAAHNSEGLPIVDGYSNRGPGIDIFGYGSNTWTANPIGTYADGQWGYFSGTSCATPTVVGMAACMMERYFYYNGIWPTPDQVKQLLISNSKTILKSSETTTWNNVNSASSNIFTRQGTIGARIDVGYSVNGDIQFEDLAGSTRKRGFFDPDDFEGNKTKQIGKRPASGSTYPRKTIRFSEVSPSDLYF